jgi:hypothetical protein
MDKCKRSVCCCYCRSTGYVVDIGQQVLLHAEQCKGPADFLVCVCVCARARYVSCVSLK